MLFFGFTEFCSICRPAKFEIQCAENPGSEQIAAIAQFSRLSFLCFLKCTLAHSPPLVFQFSSTKKIEQNPNKLHFTRILPNADQYDAMARHSGAEGIVEFAQIFLPPQIPDVQSAFEPQVGPVDHEPGFGFAEVEQADGF